MNPQPLGLLLPSCISTLRSTMFPKGEKASFNIASVTLKLISNAKSFVNVLSALAAFINSSNVASPG